MSAIRPITTPFTTFPFFIDRKQCKWCQASSKFEEISKLYTQCFEEKGDEYFKLWSVLRLDPDLRERYKADFTLLNTLLKEKTDFINAYCAIEHRKLDPIKPLFIDEILTCGMEIPFRVIVNHRHQPIRKKEKRLLSDGFIVKQQYYHEDHFSICITRKITDIFDYNLAFYLKEPKKAVIEEAQGETPISYAFEEGEEVVAVVLNPDSNYRLTIDDTRYLIRIESV